MEKKLIYMDNAATTPVKPEVLDAMLPYFTEKFGNPSSIYSISSENKKAITDAREVIAKTINTTPENIYFTAGGSESDNWALKATADAYASKGKHIITTKIEHHAILHTCEYLETKGFEITYLDVDENGLVKLDELTAAIRPDPSSRLLRSVRSHMSMAYCSTQMQYRHTHRCRSMSRQ